MSKTQSSQQEEYRQAFLRHLANRIAAIEQRIHRYRREGWEASGIAALHEDVQRLAGASGRYDLIEPSQRLLALEQTLGEHVSRKTVPDSRQGEHMLALMAAVTKSLAKPVDVELSSHSEFGAHAASAHARPDGTAPPTPVPTTAVESIKASIIAATSTRYVYHLSDGNALALDIGRRLAAEGYEVEPVETVTELYELLTSLSPQLVLVDSSRIPDLTAVGQARRDAQQRTHSKTDSIQMVAMAVQDNLQSRLDARRAGVDVLLFPPFSPADVVRHLQALMTPTVEEKVRVLIVEDDRSQALFAQSVLTNAGMQAQVELESLHVLEALEELHPDMILMDLHMPDANGVELTALIREHSAFMRTPIVFLTGESDPDARSEAINAGGDDFLTKPIRPKHLIAAVQNRVRRLRDLEKRDRALSARDVATGLYRRPYVLDRVNDALGESSDERSDIGGALFLEIDGALALRDRLGLAALERLFVEAGRMLASAIGDQEVAAPINDTAFLILATELDDDALEALAKRLREQMMQHAFDVGGKAIRLSLSVGICPLRFGFEDASALLNTAERTCREARVGNQGVKRYEPPKSVEVDQEAMRARQLREAISGDGFALIYQPIVAVQGGKDAQYQTLLRMRDASGRLLPAADILPLAERAGLMIDIDRWVLTRAMKVLRKQADNWHPVRLFIPQAMTTFAATGQDGFIEAQLEIYQVAGASLVLECRLEDALLNPPALVAFENSVRDHGVKLCLGQYEHTTDAIRLLEQVHLGFVKLAPKYVGANVTQSLRDELRLLIDRAHALGVQVIGHRVEDAQTAATLWMSGIDYIQGNLVQGAADALDFDFNAAVL